MASIFVWACRHRLTRRERLRVFSLEFYDVLILKLAMIRRVKYYDLKKLATRSFENRQTPGEKTPQLLLLSFQVWQKVSHMWTPMLKLATCNWLYRWLSLCLSFPPIPLCFGYIFVFAALRVVPIAFDSAHSSWILNRVVEYVDTAAVL